MDGIMCFVLWVRIAVYIVISGFLMILVFLLVKYVGSYEVESFEEEQPVGEISETYPLMPQKSFRLPYRTDEEDDQESSSSEDLYGGKICAICYDAPRNCFFVPCGHCATCNGCARRIMDEENKVCPICRRLIRKVRKLKMYPH